MINRRFYVQARLSQLCTETCTRETFLRIYGIDLWSHDSEAAALFKMWGANLRRRPNVTIQPDKINRWLFERFLQQEHYLPTRLAAIKFALSESDFIRLIDVMCEENMLPYSASKAKDLGLYSTSQLDNLSDHFSSMRFKIFKSQTGFIEFFHEIIRKDLGIKINTIYSACSKELNENPTEVAYEYDVITDEPMGIGHQVWLDFKKPLSLKPDACSEITFNKYHEELKQWSFSSSERNVQAQ